MEGEPRLGRAQIVGQVADAPLPAGQEPEDRDAGRIRERPGGAGESGGGAACFHQPNRIISNTVDIFQRRRRRAIPVDPADALTRWTSAASRIAALATSARATATVARALARAATSRRAARRLRQSSPFLIVQVCPASVCPRVRVVLGEGRQGDAGQSAPRFARCAFVTLGPDPLSPVGLRPSSSPAGCIARRHGGQVFGDMVDRFNHDGG